MRRPIPPSNIILLFAYLFINGLFIIKYGARLAMDPRLELLAYTVIMTTIFAFVIYGPARRSLSQSPPILQIALVLTCAAALVLLMRQFSPDQSRVARFYALHDWISRFLDGEFPYSSITNPSGLPFLYFLAMPFYFLGDLGVFQIFGFVLFAFAVYLQFSRDTRVSFNSAFLLALSPIFLFEVAARSELITNMIIIMAYLVMLDKAIPRAGRAALGLLGFGAGLIFATRAIAVVAFIPFLIYHFKNKVRGGILFLLFMAAGFFLMLLPFVIWNPSEFFANNPLTIQSIYASYWLIVLAIAGSAVAGLLARSIESVYRSIALVLFLTVGAAFALRIVSFGWHNAMQGNTFDIGYFGFSLPFIVLQLSSSGRFTETDYPKN